MELYIFDFDDTLFETDAKIYVIEPKTNKIIRCLSTYDYSKLENEVDFYRANGYKFDYSETGNSKTLKSAIPIIKYINYLKLLKKRNKDIAILTCRSVHPIYIQRCIKKHTNIKIPIKNIICVNHELTYKKIKKKVFEYDMGFKPSNNRKKMGFQYFIKKGYNKICYYDDDINNVIMSNNLLDEARRLGHNLNIYSHLV